MLVAGTRGIIVHEGKLFCVRQNGRSQWCLPGGKLEKGEPVKKGLKRELIEELGVEPKVGELMYVHQFPASNGRHFIEFFFRVTNPEDFLAVDITKTTHGELELDEVTFLDPRDEDILPVFLSSEADTYMDKKFRIPKFRIEL